MTHYYLAETESFYLDQDPDEDLGYFGHVLVKATDKDEAHKKLHRWLYELYDRMEDEWYISLDPMVRRRICRIIRVATLSDLESVLETVE